MSLGSRTTTGANSEEARASVAVMLYDVLRFAVEDGKLENAGPIVEAARLLVAGNVTESEERTLLEWFLDSDWRVTAYFREVKV